MKEYPKVPRYDHPVVEDEWFDEDVVVLEKYDGSNFRFALYDEYYQDYEEISGASNGDFILGSSSVSRHESNVDEFQDNLEFKSRLEYIKERIDKERIRDLHKKYNSPAIFFAESMIGQLLSHLSYSTLMCLLRI